jgi:hypothetical protein
VGVGEEIAVPLAVHDRQPGADRGADDGRQNLVEIQCRRTALVGVLQTLPFRRSSAGQEIGCGLDGRGVVVARKGERTHLEVTLQFHTGQHMFAAELVRFERHHDAAVGKRRVAP